MKECLTQRTPVEHHFSQVDQHLECPCTVWAVRYTHSKYSQFSECITNCPYHRSAFQIRTSSELNLAEMMFNTVRRSFSPPSAAHALLVSSYLYYASSLQV